MGGPIAGDQTYQIATVATVMANKVVYSEGVNWLTTIPEYQRIEACRTYLKNEKQKQNLIDEVQDSRIDGKEQIMEILHNYAARELTLFDLQKSRSSLKNGSNHLKIVGSESSKPISEEKPKIEESA